jgi:TPR repeat protein
MASLTPLSKGLIALAVVGGMASAVWHLDLKDRLAGGGASSAVSQPAAPSVPQPAPSTIAPPVQPAPPAEQPQVSAVPAVPAAVAQSETSPPPPSPKKVESKAPESKLSVAENAETGRKLLAAGDFAQARTHLELAVQGGDGGAACHLGEMTLKGQGGIHADREKAASLFQLAQSRGIICFASGQ